MKLNRLLSLAFLSIVMFSCNMEGLEETEAITTESIPVVAKLPVPEKDHGRIVVETGTPPAIIESTIPNTTQSRIGENNSLGIWLWYIQGTGYNSHAALAAKLKSLKIKRIYVKVADGGYNPDAWPEVDDKSVTSAYKAQGIEVYAWSYNYPGNEAAQTKALYQAAKAGYEGFVTDIEIEFDRKTTELTTIFSQFKAQKTKAINDGYASSNFKLYCTTWGNPEDHGMRVDIIDQYVDGHMPQTYVEVWGPTYQQNPAQWVQSGTAEYRRLGCVKPVHHIVSDENDTMTSVQMNSFIAASGAETSLWRVPGGGTSLNIWNTLQNVNWDVQLNTSTGSITLNTSATIQVGVPVTISGTCSTSTAKVKLYADTFLLQDITPVNGTWTYTYTFNTAGNNRVLSAKAYNASSTITATASKTINVLASGSVINAIISSNINIGNYMFNGTASSDIAKVDIFVDSFPIGSVNTLSGSWSSMHTFTSVDVANNRVLTIKGKSSTGAIIATQIYNFNVIAATLTSNVPTSITIGNSFSFAGTASSNVAKIEATIDGFPIGTPSTINGNWSFSHAFTSVDVANNRMLILKGKSATGVVLATKTYSVNIIGSLPFVQNVPYFYQYNNSINPGGSCQNTTMAMVLKYYLLKAGNITAAGNMNPDYLSSFWGTSQAQTVSGYQGIFNSEASALGLSVRDSGTTTMSILSFRNAAASGKPIVVHGYFTSFGHVITVLGYDGTYYYCNDPAGKWSQIVSNGGYSTVNSTEGRAIKYSKQAFEAAISPDGNVWTHIFN